MAKSEGMQNHKHRHLKKRNELLIHAAAWMNLRTRQKATYSVIPFWNILETQSYRAGGRINGASGGTIDPTAGISHSY